jgi:hypothetical protein
MHYLCRFGMSIKRSVWRMTDMVLIRSSTCTILRTRFERPADRRQVRACFRYGEFFTWLKPATWRNLMLRKQQRNRNVRELLREASEKVSSTTEEVGLWHYFKRLRWSRDSVLAFGTQVRGFTPGRSRRIFRARKSSARLPSEGK